MTSRSQCHTGGPLSGYLIAKLGIDERVVGHEGQLPGRDDVTEANQYLLVIDAVVRAGRASYIGGGKYVFVDASNEPDHIVDALRRVGFRSITGTGHPMHVMKLGRPLRRLSESQLRRRARSQGLELIKYSEGTQGYEQYGPYLLADQSNRPVAYGSLDDVARKLSGT